MTSGRKPCRAPAIPQAATIGYGFGVTDVVRPHELTHLTAAETRLSAVLDRPRRVALACIVTLAGLGWLGVGVMSDGAGAWPALCRPTATGGLSDLLLAVPMWVAMTLAMMLPTAGPMILTYAEIADTAARKGEPVVSPLILATGYLAVWLGFALAASLVQALSPRAALTEAGSAGLLASGAIFLLAGAYQFSALKRACLTQCQRPFPFFFANWTSEPVGVVRLGLRQGLHCLGCCWAMMLLMFAVGAMNVIWMAALGAIMTIEKLTTTPRFAHVVGAIFIAIGLGFIVTGFI
jgi:predicted metal-binding membrane protein